MLRYKDICANSYLVYDYVPNGICIIDNTYTIKFWNLCLEGWSGVKRGEIVGKNLLELFPNLKLPKFKTRFDLMFQGRPPMVFSPLLNHYIFPIINSNGEYQAQSATLTSLPGAGKNSYDILISIDNVTTLFNRVINYRNLKNQALGELEKRKLAEEKSQIYANQLEELNATKDKFFSIIAHDLINPISTQYKIIATILNNFEHYQKEDFYKMLENLDKSSNNTYRLLENLLTWSRSQLNKIDCNMDNCDIGKIIELALGNIELAARDKNISINLPVINDIFVYCDLNMLNTILRNLLSNAVKFTNYGGKISINVRQNDDFTEIDIEDNGIGMAMEIADSLFKLDRTISTRGTNDEAGTGLGLIICKEFLSKINGTINVKSILGIGSTFTVRLPNNKE